MNKEFKDKVKEEVKKALENHFFHSIAYECLEKYLTYKEIREMQDNLAGELADAVEKWCNKHQAFAKHRGW